MPPNQQAIELIIGLTNKIRPELVELFFLLNKANLEKFELEIPSGDKLCWNNQIPSPISSGSLQVHSKPDDLSGDIPYKEYSQKELKEELTRVLDLYYPHETAIYMGMIWSKNDVIADRLLEALEKYRQRERLHVEQQIYAILTAFKFGNK